jgi:site-specific DNA recombinase
VSAGTLDVARPSAVTHGDGRAPYAYNRLSQFRPKQMQDVEVTRPAARQAADAERVAAERDLGPVVHITDEGQSASRFAAKPRDGWPVLLDAIRAGRVSYVLVWLLDRATRQTRELDDLLDACREAGTLILQTGTGTIIDADNPDSVAMAKIQGALAEAEVAKMSKRVRRATAEKAVLGQFHGGKRRWGYNADMSAVNEGEALVIKAVARDIIRGRALYSIAKELTDKGIPGPQWKGIPYAMPAWEGGPLRKLIMRPHLAGLRQHGKTFTEGTWEPILDRETWDSVCAILAAPGRKTTPGTARRHLLAGIATCGVCGSRLRSSTIAAGRPGGYKCPRAHVQRPRHLVDAVVVAAVVGLLSRPDFAAVLLPEPDGDREALEARITALEAELLGYGVERRQGLITPAQMHQMTADTNADIATARAHLATLAVAARVPIALEPLAGNPDATAVWDGLDLNQRRTVIDAVAHVTVHRAARRGAPFDPEAVEIRWKMAGPAV